MNFLQILAIAILAENIHFKCLLFYDIITVSNDNVIIDKLSIAALVLTYIKTSSIKLFHK